MNPDENGILQQFEPYSRPQTTQEKFENKTSLIWKDFQQNVRKRRGIIDRLKEAAQGSATPLAVLKKTLLELRQVTLAVVEDALEVEYHSRVSTAQEKSGSRQSRRGRRMKLPPINSYSKIEEHEEIYPLAEMINDCEELFTIPNIKVILPINFPSIRNPFMLGKTIDELATIVPPHPEPGNLEDELKSLELLRFKRSARALLRAEAQVINRLPLNLFEIERVIERMRDDPNLEVLLRSVCTLIDNDRVDRPDQEPDLTCLMSPLFNVEAHELLRKLNEYRGVTPMRVDVKVLINQKLRSCTFDYLIGEPVPRFLLEWIQTIIGGRDLRMTPDETSFELPEDRKKLSSLNRQGNRSSQSRASSANINLTSQDRFNAGKDDADLVSVVDSKNGYVKTHEKIHTPSEPRTKTHLKIISQTVLSKSQATSPKEMSTQFSPEKSKIQKRQIESKTVNHLEKEGDDISISNKKVTLSIKRKIRMEVEKALKELGSGERTKKTDHLFNSTNEDSNPANFDALSSVRYELNKMQQELLRRQVLDPRHYNVSSIDSITHAHRGLTVDNINSFNPLEKKKGGYEDENKLTPYEIASKVVKVETKDNQTMELILTITFRPESNDLLCTISLLYEDAIKFGFIKDQSTTSLRVDKSPHIISYFTISQLIFSKLTEYTIEDLVQAKPDQRKRMMQNIFEQITTFANSKPLQRGQLMANVDRVLFQNQFAEDNVLVKLVISRNTECDGILVTCIPLAGLYGSGIGPVTLTMSDNELEVLLISQHGLFIKAKNRWDSMVVIASWIAGRLHVCKVATKSNIEIIQPKDKSTLIADDLGSITSQLTYSPRKIEAESKSTIESPKKKPSNLTSVTQPLLMLEVSIDRQIEISKTLLEHWKTRNLPNLLGLEVTLTAVQDLEVLEIRLTLVVPSKLNFKKLQDEEETKSGLHSVKKKKGGLLLLDEDSEEEEDAYGGYDDDKSTIIELSYRLTRAELLIFGTTELVDHKKIGMSKNSSQISVGSNNQDVIDEHHPERMVWNILNRLKVVFKGSKKNPFNASASATDPENWHIHYERILVRDVKTVSQVILMLRVSAIGGDLLIEGDPVDANNKQKIGKKIVNEKDIKETVYSEGWEISYCTYERRKEENDWDGLR